jgi:hypothetical protein
LCLHKKERHKNNKESVTAPAGGKGDPSKAIDVHRRRENWLLPQPEGKPGSEREVKNWKYKA